MHTKLVKIAHGVQEISCRTDRQTHRHTDALITILRKSRVGEWFRAQCCVFMHATCRNLLLASVRVCSAQRRRIVGVDQIRETTSLIDRRMAGNSAATPAQSRLPVGQQQRPSVLLSLVVCVFAVGAFLPIRALWIQLPGTLAAESSGHHEHLLAVSVLSNVVAVVYLVVRHCGRDRRDLSSSSAAAGTEAAAIYVSTTCGLASLGLLTVGHGTSSTSAVVARLLPSWTAATALLTAAGLGAAAASLAAVTYIPFAGRLDRVRSAGGNCICAVLVGDALSSLIPHVLALAQG